MSNFRLTTKAKADLLHIGRITQRKWGKHQRNKYLRELDDTFHFLAENPLAGASCEEITAKYRKQPSGSHIIFYKQGTRYTVEIIRVLHKRMDATIHMK